LGEDAYEAVIEPELPDFVSQEFEKLCRDALPNLFPEETFLDIGRWWYKEHNEVDVVGFTTDETMVVGECKFTNAPLDYSALVSLEDHAAEIRWTPDTGTPIWNTYCSRVAASHNPYRKRSPNVMTYTCLTYATSQNTPESVSADKKSSKTEINSGWVTDRSPSVSVERLSNGDAKLFDSTVKRTQDSALRSRFCYRQFREIVLLSAPIT